jgi:uncharacterized membrane protein
MHGEKSIVQPSRVILGSLLVAVGIVFIGQGLGVIRNQSFMVDDPTWALVGAILVIAGVALLAWGRIGSSRG